MNLKSAFTLFSLAVAGYISLAGDAVPVYQNKPEDSVESINDLAGKVMPKSGGDGLFYLDRKNGRVGIGITTPTVELDVAGDIRADNLTIGTINGSTIGSSLALPFLIAREENTGDGGTCNAGAWRTRTLNTLSTNTISGASLSSNQVTLGPGSYYAQFAAPSWQTDRHQAKLVSTSGASVSIAGIPSYSESAANAGDQTLSIGSGVFVVPDSSSTVLEVQHRCENTASTIGFGTDAGFDITNVYSTLEIWQLRE